MKNFISQFVDNPLLAFQNLPVTGWIALFSVGALVLIYMSSLSQGSAELAAPSPVASIDTYIPAGMNLIPLEFENHESVDSILGTYGVVDIYASLSEYQKSTKPLAQGVKILRAPRNPSQFAVLVPEQMSSIFFKQEQKFFAAVRNPKVSGPHFETSKPSIKPRRPILIFEGSEP